MADQITPKSRIFHIGRECYVIYLGRERDDIRPFLRIGNIRGLPSEVIDVISTTIVTDDHVGNPLLELRYAPDVKGRYLGDPRVVSAIRRFFKSFELPTDEVEDYRQIKDREKRHMVWFYSDGNIQLHYDNSVIFDLREREDSDRHFLPIYEATKTEFNKNPLRYIKQNFTGPGLFLNEGGFYWFENGEILTLAVSPGFITNLMNTGVDPDLITSMGVDVTLDDLGSGEVWMIIGFIKRIRKIRKQLRLITREFTLFNNLKLLFPVRGEQPPTITAVTVPEKRAIAFHDSRLKKDGEGWRIRHPQFPEVSVGTVGAENSVVVKPEDGTLSVNLNHNRTDFQIPEGFPLTLQNRELDSAGAVNRYIVRLIPLIEKYSIGERESETVELTERYCRAALEDVSAGTTMVSARHKQTALDLTKAVKQLKPGEGGSPAWFVYANAGTIIDMFLMEAQGEHPLSRTLRQVRDALGGFLKQAEQPDRLLPFWGDFYVHDTPCILWRSTNKFTTVRDVVKAKNTVTRIASVTKLDDQPLREDRDRLMRLIRSLARGGKGELTAEQLNILKAEETRDKKPKEESSAAVSAPRQPAPSASLTFGSLRSGMSPGRGKKSRSRLWWLLIPLILLLLLGGAWLWDRSGTAPWNRSDESSMVSTGDESDGRTTGDEMAGDGVTGDGTTGDGMAGDGDSVDPDSAPRTQAEVNAYLSVVGRVNITDIDVHLAANEIAVANGYRDLDYRVFVGQDPDWIWPGNELDMPDDSVHRVASGDTIWFLSARMVRVEVLEDLKSYDQSVMVLEDTSSSDSERAGARRDLERMAEFSRAEEMRDLAQRTLDSHE